MLRLSLSMPPPAVVVLVLAYLGMSPCRAIRPARMVVGIQSDSLAHLVTALHVVVRVDGDVTDDETVLPPRGSLVPFPQPWEKAMTTMNGASALDVSVEAIGKPGEKPLPPPLASTRFVPGQAPRLLVQLDSRCMVFPPIVRGPGSAPGPLSGPT